MWSLKKDEKSLFFLVLSAKVFFLWISGKFSDMMNDGYIHWNLLRHMLRAGLIEEAQKLITDLKWLAAKLDVTGPADLLNDYLSIKGHVDNKVQVILFDHPRLSVGILNRKNVWKFSYSKLLNIKFYFHCSP